MYYNVNKIVARRLVFVWLALSLIVGYGVYYLEQTKIKDYVRDLALSESVDLNSEAADLIASGLNDRVLALLRERVDALTKRHFVVAEIYDRHQSHLVVSIRFDSPQIERRLESRPHYFPEVGAIRYDSVELDDQLYAQVLVPLVASSGELVGYFDGVYHVDPATLGEIHRRVYRTLFLVLAIVLASAVVLYPLIISLNRELMKFSRDLLRANVQLMKVLGSAVATRDTTTNSHNYRVTLYAVRLGEALELDDAQIRDLMAGSFLHDVGKIGINDDVLRKPGSLSDEETELMRQHVMLGLSIVTKAEWTRAARDVIEFHHERYDGHGYVRGLKGDEIPLKARIFAVVDVFDALTSKRPYKKAVTEENALQMLEEERGRHFDPRVLQAFMKIAKGLYDEISHASDAHLEQMLATLEKRYFFRGRAA